MLDAIVLATSLLSLLFMSGQSQQFKMSIPADPTAAYYLVHVNGGTPRVVQNKVKKDCNCIETKVHLEKNKIHVVDVVSVDRMGRRHTILSRNMTTGSDGKLMTVPRPPQHDPEPPTQTLEHQPEPPAAPTGLRIVK